MSYIRSERVEKLRQGLLEARDEMSVERPLLVTESYKQTEGEPNIIRRAKALKHILDNMTLLIREGELIVGHQTEKVRGVPMFPETGAIWIENELDIFDKRKFKSVRISDEDKARLKPVLEYWKPRTIHSKLYKSIPEKEVEVLGFENTPVLPNLFIRNAVGHLLLDYGMALEKGFLQVADEAAGLASQLDLSSPENLDRWHFYKAVEISCKAVSDFGMRYSEFARKKAEETSDEERRKELLKISDVCARVPAYPARDFHEALQSFWFVQLITQIDTDGLAISPGRFDRYMYPYYKADVEKGTLTAEYAQELLNCMWVKFYEIIKLVDNPNLNDMAFGTGNNLSQNLVVGGTDKDGIDATNEISYMCLTADATVRFDQPSLSVRVHPESPTAFLEKIVEVIKLGGGKPAIFFDQAAVPSLLSTGVELEEARDYALCGCVEPATVYNSYTWANGAMFSLPKCVELALNDGVCLLTGKQMGPKTGSPAELDSYDKVYAAFEAQVEYFLKELVTILNTCDRLHSENLQTPFVSALTHGCMEKGKDITAGGAKYNYIGVQGVGLADAADSLMAVKKAVFEERKVELGELVEVMKKDFAEAKELQESLISGYPKYGNDIDEVDMIARKIGLFFSREVSSYRCFRGGAYRPGLFPVASNVPMGKRVAALPSGRNARMPLADGISPCPGCDENGPTAVIKSVTKVDHISIPNGTLLNLKFHPSAISGKAGTGAMISLIKAMSSRRGMHLQFNIVSAKTLRDAQAHPERYRDLLIRVAGYSALFVDLDKNLQDHIISRTEHGEC